MLYLLAGIGLGVLICTAINAYTQWRENERDQW
jgi:hypothetical protein